MNVVIQELVHENKLKMKEMEYMKDNLEVSRRECSELEAELKEVKFESQTFENEVKILKETIDSENKLKESASSDLKKTKKEIEKFKANNLYSLKSYFSIMGSADLPEVINLSHEDPEVVKGMMETIKKRKFRENSFSDQLNQIQLELSEKN